MESYNFCPERRVLYLGSKRRESTGNELEVATQITRSQAAEGGPELAATSPPSPPPLLDRHATERTPSDFEVRLSQQLPHDVHVLVVARPHLLPQLPQPCSKATIRRSRQACSPQCRVVILPVLRMPRRVATPIQTRRTGNTTTRSHHLIIDARASRCPSSLFFGTQHVSISDAGEREKSWIVDS